MPFLIGMNLQAILAILQFISQGSLGGVWYYLGERTFTGTTPEIANASLLGHLILRPYGTLPHPNILGACLLFGCFILLRELFNKSLSWRLQLLVLLDYTFLFIGLLLSFSRTSILAGVLGSLVFLITQKTANKKKTVSIVIVVCFILGLFLPYLVPRFFVLFSDQAYAQRLVYLQESLQLFLKYPLFGVGWNAYLPALASLSSISDIQPVHSIFILYLVQSGVIGVILIVLALKKISQKCLFSSSIFSYVIIGTILFLGSFDHYFLTLQQGQLLFVFLLALVYSKSNSVINE
jgi:O-antigen ligase